jgi:hypothetical protein
MPPFPRPLPSHFVERVNITEQLFYLHCSVGHSYKLVCSKLEQYNRSARFLFGEALDYQCTARELC